MGFLDSLFDKREKLDYCKGCDYIFNLALTQAVQFSSEFNDIQDEYYRANIVGIVMAYLDTKPADKCVSFRSTFGKDTLYYGTVHGTMLVESHPIQANLKTEFIPLFQNYHTHYSNFISNEMNNNLNATTVRILAQEVLQHNNVVPDTAKINAIAVDINALIEIIDALLSKYKFV